MDSNIPLCLWSILSEFESCFSRPESFGNFLKLVLGWILCKGRHTISRVIQASGAVEEGRGHSAFYRFFSRSSWSPDLIGLKLLGLIVCIYSQLFLGGTIFLIIDDTLMKKRGGRLFGAGMHHDGSASTYGRGPSGKPHKAFSFGHNWVVLSVFVPLPRLMGRGISIPILFRLYRPKKLTPVEHYRKRTVLAREMLDLLLKTFPERRFLLLGDNEYACRTVVRDLPDQMDFVGPMPKDAALYGLPGPRKNKRGRKPLKGKRLRSLERIAADRRIPWRRVVVSIYGKEVELEIKTLTCLWYTVAGTRPVKVVYSRDPRGRYEERAYFSTDVSMAGTAIIEAYSKRWALECSFRNGKQSMGVADPQNGFSQRSSIAAPPRACKTTDAERGQKAVLLALHALWQRSGVPVAVPLAVAPSGGTS
mgnify:CR=1 FL=1